MNTLPPTIIRIMTGMGDYSGWGGQTQAKAPATIWLFGVAWADAETRQPIDVIASIVSEVSGPLPQIVPATHLEYRAPMIGGSRNFKALWELYNIIGPNQEFRIQQVFPGSLVTVTDLTILP